MTFAESELVHEMLMMHVQFEFLGSSSSVLSLVSGKVAVITIMASPALPSPEIPPVSVEAVLLDLHAAKAVGLPEMENGFQTCKWVLEVLDLEKNQIANRSDWACLCVSLWKASMCSECQDPSLLKEIQHIEIHHLAPLHSLGAYDIQKLAGTPLMNVKAQQLCDLHGLIHRRNLISDFPWLGGVQEEIQKLHLDLTGEYNTDLMTS